MRWAYWVMTRRCTSDGDYCDTGFASDCGGGFESSTRLRRWGEAGSYTGVVGERGEKSMSRGSRLMLPGLWGSSLSG